MAIMLDAYANCEDCGWTYPRATSVCRDRCPNCWSVIVAKVRAEFGTLDLSWDADAVILLVSRTAKNREYQRKSRERRE